MLNLEKIYKDIRDQGVGVVEEKYKDAKHLEFARDKEGDTLLNYAILENRLDLVQFFVKSGASPFIYNLCEVNGMMLAAGGADTKILECLVDKFQDGFTQYDQSLLLEYALAFEQHENVRYLMEKGFECNAVAEESIKSIKHFNSDSEQEAFETAVRDLAYKKYYHAKRK